MDAFKEEKAMCAMAVGEALEEAGSRISHDPFCHMAAIVPICGSASCAGCVIHTASPMKRGRESDGNAHALSPGGGD